MAAAEFSGVVQFGEFKADLRSGELHRNGVRVPLQEQPFQVLAVLLVRAGELVKRDELHRQVWPRDTFVEFDHALNTAIKKIRIALEDDASAPRYIETIPKRGYRFVASVRTANDSSGAQTEAGSHPGEGLARRWFARPPAAVALCLTLLVSVVLLGMRSRISSPAATGNRIVLAVLPFENWTHEAKCASLSDGIAQEVITQTGNAEPSQLQVVAWATCSRYGHTTKDIAEIGRELHADYLLEGNLRGDAGRVRVTVELIRASDATRVWGDEFNRETGDALALESEVASVIAAKVRGALFPVPRGTR
jgi:TolB-like protein/DNA-binding winged helix-turn-helix (wHTH) protein